MEIAGVEDERQSTVTVAGTLSGKLLPFQVLYEGETEWCYPSTVFLPEWFEKMLFSSKSDISFVAFESVKDD